MGDMLMPFAETRRDIACDTLPVYHLCPTRSTLRVRFFARFKRALLMLTAHVSFDY